ncbi:protein HEXIM1 isoform X2 [Toxorhynchites rutilus septentrionalis]|uniref:protein HEXIM1 isoform X2 n=1 Tax=Toxorhynchites rutilus septentrionalis TaxID=329112 RepID=UPI0024796DEA|nr:protein HEXIM1 isoform X2 [Toxorhynchites rutilus septentrionalis]
MSAKNVENTAEKENLLAKQNDVARSQSATSAVTEALGAAAEQTNERSEIRSDAGTKLAPPLVVHAPAAATLVVDDEFDTVIGGSELNGDVAGSSAGGHGGGSSSSSSSGGVGGGRGGLNSEKRRSNGDKNTSRRKTRRGKTKRGKKSSSKPYTKSQWKFQVPPMWTATNKRRAEAALVAAAGGGGGIVPLKGPYHQSDHPPLVPYNTNRFLMEDHMPHVLTPSEDEEEFLTKEFSSVYEDARSERLEGLSKTQLIQEYLQLEANFEQITRRYNAVKSLSIREENESAAVGVNNAMPAKDAPGGSGGGVDRRRLEDRIRELTAENLELRRQLEHASRIGMVLSAKSSPRNNNNNNNSNPAAVERMDSSSCTSSEDSESDSSTSTSSSSSDDDDEENGGGSSSSSMSDTDGDLERQPLVLMDSGDRDGAQVATEPNGEQHLPNELLWVEANSGQQNGGREMNGRFSPLDADWG